MSKTLHDFEMARKELERARQREREQQELIAKLREQAPPVVQKPPAMPNQPRIPNLIKIFCVAVIPGRDSVTKILKEYFL